MNYDVKGFPNLPELSLSFLGQGRILCFYISPEVSKYAECNSKNIVGSCFLKYFDALDMIPAFWELSLPPPLYSRVPAPLSPHFSFERVLLTPHLGLHLCTTIDLLLSKPLEWW